MENYKDKITLVRNSRGCYIIDTVKGCSMCIKKPLGCYDNCYAANIANRYKFDFKVPVLRKFKKENKQLYFLDFYDTKHEQQIIKKIKKIKMPFIRIGEMGDPSQDWKHTLNICNIIKKAGKKIVIVTKHLSDIPEKLLKEIGGLYINTSISALDTTIERKHRLKQYNRLKPYCNSILRIVSCDFNINNIEGKKRKEIQGKLFNNEKVIDTILRPNNNSLLVTDKIINVKEEYFLRSKVIVSRYNNNTYFGNCEQCTEYCGLNI